MHVVNAAHDNSIIIHAIFSCRAKHFFILPCIEYFLYLVIDSIFPDNPIAAFKCYLTVTCIHAYICNFFRKFIHRLFCKLRVSYMYSAHHITKASYPVHIWHPAYEASCLLANELCL